MAANVRSLPSRSYTLTLPSHLPARSKMYCCVRNVFVLYFSNESGDWNYSSHALQNEKKFNFKKRCLVLYLFVIVGRFRPHFLISMIRETFAFSWHCKFSDRLSQPSRKRTVRRALAVCHFVTVNPLQFYSSDHTSFWISF